VRDYFRMFLMPGVLHCGGGPGPDTVDWPAAIADWVENGKAPDQVIARKAAAGGAVSRTRPPCPYPQHAEYTGSGSMDDAANFVCQEATNGTQLSPAETMASNPSDPGVRHLRRGVIGV
jgi:feruloyl esterase